VTDERLERADELLDRARTEPLAQAQELGEAAARLRMQVLGEKPYPVLACAQCWRLTGWLGSEDRCDVCISTARREAAYEDPGGSFAALRGLRAAAPRQRHAAWKRVAAVLGVGGPLALARVQAWCEHVDMGVTGPPSPEEGYVAFDGERGEWPAPEGHDLLVRFSTRAFEFHRDGWQQALHTGGPVVLTPHVFPASLPMYQLAEAWTDYRAEIQRFGAARWQAEEARRESDRQEAQDLAEAREEQTGTSGLLD
jgi:hypothetical protein